MARRDVAAAAVVGAGLFAGACALPSVGLLDAGTVGDTPLYRTYAAAILDGAVPYRDFYFEYPPGALLPILVPAGAEGAAYATWFKVAQLAFGIATVALVAVTAGRLGAGRRRLFAAAAAAGIAPAALGPVELVHFDLWPVFLASAALAALLVGRNRVGGALLGAAAAAKIYPLVLVPLVLVYVLRRRGRREAALTGTALVAAAAGFLVPFALLAPGGLGYSLWVQARRPLQIESLGSSLLLAAHRLGVYEAEVVSSFGSQNLAGRAPDVLAALTSLAGAAAVVAIWVAIARRPASARSLVEGAAAAVAAVVAFNKVLSPQFMTWLVPLVALAWGRLGLAAGAIAAGALGLTQAWFPGRFGEVVRLEAPVWLVVARNLLLVALFLTLAARIRAGARESARGGGAEAP